MREEGARDAKQKFEQCLGRRIKLKVWMENRMGEEIRFHKVKDGEEQLHQINHGREKSTNILEEQSGPCQRNSGVESRGRSVASDDLGQDKPPLGCRTFFKKLPTDQLTPPELDLRQALIEFLNDWQYPYPATIADALEQPDVITARNILNHGRAVNQHVPLRLWMDRRIGGEIEMVAPPDAQQRGIVFLGFRGELEPDIAQFIPTVVREKDMRRQDRNKKNLAEAGRAEPTSKKRRL